MLPVLRTLCLIFTVLTATSIWAAPRRVAVLTLQNSAGLSTSEVRYVTDRVRAALLRLPSSQFVVLTRENILALLPPGTQLADCEGDCEVTTGRLLGADLIITGDVLRFGQGLRVTLRAHDVSSAKWVASTTASGHTVEALERPTLDAARALALKLPAGAPTARLSPLPALPKAVPNQTLPDDSGFLVITSRPPGATVRVDGVLTGTTPQQHELALGTHTVEVRHPLHHPQRRTLRMTPAGARLELTLAPAHGELRIDGGPDGAQIRINGEPVGRVPWSAPQKASGDYLVTVEAPCHAPFEKRVTVRDGQRTQIRPQLKPICGALTVQSTPTGAAIFINDTPTGEVTPHTFVDQQPGVVRLRLEAPGHTPHHGRTQVRPRTHPTHQAQLEPQYGFLSVMAEDADGTPCSGPLKVDGRPVGQTPWKGKTLAHTVQLAVRCPSGTAVGRAVVDQNQRQTARLVVGRSAGPDRCEAQLAQCLEAAGTSERAYRQCFYHAEICGGGRAQKVDPQSAAYVWQHAGSPRSQARKTRRPGLDWSWMPQVDRLRDFHLLQAVIWLTDRTQRLHLGLAVSALNVHIAETTPDGFAPIGISFGTQLVGRARIIGPLRLVSTVGVNGGWVPCKNGSSDSQTTAQETANDQLCTAATGDSNGEPDIGFASLTTRALLEVGAGGIAAQAGWVRASYFGDDLVQFGATNGFTLGMQYDF